MAILIASTMLGGNAPAADLALPADNPFARPSPLPYQFPPFDRIRDSDFGPAYAAGMAMQRAEITAIAGSPEPPSFENTIVALERSGQVLTRVKRVFENLAVSNSDPVILKLEDELAPKLAAHADAIHFDATLFGRIEALYRARAQLPLDAESRQLLLRYHVEFVRAGARLGAADKAQLSRLNQELAALTTRFRQNVLKAGADAAIVVDDIAQLDGLSSAQIDAAAAAARSRGFEGRWLIALDNTTTQPLLAQLRYRALRERLYRASVTRARYGACDNTRIIARIVKLRAERAHLLGYPSHAAYVLEDQDAHDSDAAERLLRQIGASALQSARRDAAELQRLIVARATAEHRPSFTLQPWDWPYYAEQLRRQRFDYDSEQVKDYFELSRVLQDGVFYVAHELYGLSFKQRSDLPVYHADVRVFEVLDADGSPLALFLADYYARANKQGGAWMDNFVGQSRLLGMKPVVINNLNLTKPAPGEPTLLSFDEVRGLFHEFGHALHGMLSNVEYPLLSGTNVPNDFVEYPSQFNEMWAREPAVVAHFARHWQNGAPLPPGLLRTIIASRNFDEGYRTSEYVQAALIDLAWHELSAAQTPDAGRVAAFDDMALEARGLAFASVPPRYHSTYFLHIFAGNYSAGYYAYLWSEILARDTGAWLHAHGGLNRANGATLRAKILSRGHSEDVQRLFEEFYGGPPDIAPLLEYRGLN
jgi:peptidyl-dipeptidase Dcp